MEVYHAYRVVDIPILQPLFSSEHLTYLNINLHIRNEYCPEEIMTVSLISYRAQSSFSDKSISNALSEYGSMPESRDWSEYQYADQSRDFNCI